MQKASLGRIVIFVDDNGNQFAAIITKVWSDVCVNLFVFPTSEPLEGPNSVFTSIVYNEDSSVKYSWHWPPRV